MAYNTLHIYFQGREILARTIKAGVCEIRWNEYGYGFHWITDGELHSGIDAGEAELFHMVGIAPDNALRVLTREGAVYVFPAGEWPAIALK